MIRAGVPENKRTYSSVYNNDKIGTGHARSIINSAQGWSAAANKAGEWIQLDLGKVQMVAGTVIQPRGTNYQYVTEYTVSTSVDGNSWTSVPGVHQGHATELKEVRFPNGAVVRARYVRLIVKAWVGHVSLRADVLIVPGAGMSRNMHMSLSRNAILRNHSHFPHAIPCCQSSRPPASSPVRECQKICALTAACGTTRSQEQDTRVRPLTHHRVGRQR